MKKIYIILMVIALILGIVGGIFFYHIWKNREDDWPGETGDEDIEYYLFKDVSESYWASTYISYVTQREMMSADDANYFHPEENMSVKDFMITLLKAVMPRVDISELSNQELILFLQERKIINSDFAEEKLDSSVTNYDAAMLLAKIDIHMRENKQLIKDIAYQDIGEIDAVGRTLIGHCIARGFLRVKNTKSFYPNKALTRAEIAEMVYLFLNG